MTTSGQRPTSPSPWPTLTTGMSNPSLPLVLTPSTKKKSHARKQPPGHIPRPRNAFILFRCDFVRQRKLPPAVENDHRNISRIVGRIWREMPQEQKRPWLDLAELEKETHAVLYPGYKYSPGASAGRPGRRQKNKGDGFGVGAGAGRADQKDKDTSPTAPFRRSSSCPPPGAVPIIPAANTPYDPVRFALTTRDDLAPARRPSLTTIYHSAASTAQAAHPSMGAHHALAQGKGWADNAVPMPMPSSTWMASQLGPPLMALSYGVVAQPAGSPWGWGGGLQPYQWPTAAQAPDSDANGRKQDVGGKDQNLATTAAAEDLGLDFSSFDWARYISEMPSYTNPFQTEGPGPSQSATPPLSLHQGIPPTHGPEGCSPIDKPQPHRDIPASATDADQAYGGQLFAGAFGFGGGLGPIFVPGTENGTRADVKSPRGGGEVEADLGCAFPRLSLDDSQ